MKLEEIRPIAEKYMNKLEPYCKRIEIAGSIRREKVECRDIELVLIRHESKLLEMRFVEIVDSWKKIRGSATGRYTQRELPEGAKLDIFMAQEDNWGNIFLQRTGNWRFSRWALGIRAKEVGLLHRCGYLQRDGEQLSCYEEVDVFRLLKIDWIDPKDREWE